MTSQEGIARRVQAENHAGGIQPLHQGDGDLGVNTGGNSFQNNVRQQNFFQYGTSTVTESNDEIKPSRSNIIDMLMAQSLSNFWDLEHHHELLRSEVVAGTGTWILEREEIRTWKRNRSNLVWMNGDLGSGKTMLASSIICSIKPPKPTDKVACVYIYFQGAQDTQPSYSHILINLLKQILWQQTSDEVSEDLKSMYNTWHRLKKRPGPKDYLVAFQSCCTKFSEAYLVIDALDDCRNSSGEKTQEKMLEAIGTLRHHLKILVTSRTRWLDKVELKADQELHVTPYRRDIELYVKSRIERDKSFGNKIDKSGMPNFEGRVISKVFDATGGMFLITKLYMEHLCQQETAGDIEAALSGLPKNIQSAFETSIQQIKKKDNSKETRKGGLAKHVLNWVTNAVVPMKADQICLAFALNHSESTLNKDYIPEENDLIFACAGLVTIDSKSRTLRLVHESVREHLVEHKIIQEKGHMEMAKACLLCLLLNDLDGDVEMLAKYCAEHWITHFRKGEQDSSAPEMQNLALRFLDDRKKLSRAFGFISEPTSRFPGMSGLHAAVYFDNQPWAETFLDKGTRVDIQCLDGQTALHWATKYGRDSLVALLIDRGASVDIHDKMGDAPLHIALIWPNVDCGNIARRLVKANAKINRQGSKHWTPISWAIAHGCLEDVEMLLMDESFVNMEDCRNWTPLREAICHGDNKIVSLLLKKGADPNQIVSTDHPTPLVAAIQWGSETIARSLIEGGAEVNHHDNKGFSPLRWAVDCCRQKIVELLIDNKASLEDRDKIGLTPLLAAVSKNPTTIDEKKIRKTVIWALLEHGFRPNDSDGKGRTCQWIRKTTEVLLLSHHRSLSQMLFEAMISSGARTTIREAGGAGLEDLDSC